MRGDGDGSWREGEFGVSFERSKGGGEGGGGGGYRNLTSANNAGLEIKISGIL